MSDLKPCPVCKGQSGGIGSDGVENDCMACFAREVQAASPRVEACIASCLARYHGDSKAAQARYFEEVHQRLAPLARSLEIELAEAKAELARRTQPEATAPATIPKVEIELPAGDPRKVKIHLDTITDGVRWLCCTIESPAAQDLSAAILNWSGIADRLNELDKAIAHSTNLTPQSKPRRLLYAILHEVCSSPANALSAGDRVDAVEGDLLPPVGSKVLIHLARQDEWVEHTVTGYYAWADLSGRYDVHRVFVRVVDAAGYDNARLLKDVRLQSQKGGSHG